MNFIGSPTEQAQEWANHSPLVFEASVSSLEESPRTTVDGMNYRAITTTLEVYRVWKGAVGPQVTLGPSTPFACIFGFERGRQYLVFARVEKGKPFVGYCEGTIPLEAAGDMTKYFEHSTGAICGTVRNPDGQPAVGAEVIVWKRDAKENRYRSYRTIVGADGTYRLGLLSPRKYSLIAMLQSERPPIRQVGFYQKLAPRNDEDWTVEVEAGRDACGFDMELVRQPLVTIRGRVQTEDGDGDAKTSECSVFLRGTTVGHPLETRRFTLVQADGSFVFEGVPQARLYAYASCYKPNEDGTVWRGASVWVTNREEVVLPLRRIQAPPRPRFE